jgi:hypothetical protein
MIVSFPAITLREDPLLNFRQLSVALRKIPNHHPNLPNEKAALGGLGKRLIEFRP